MKKILLSLAIILVIQQANAQLFVFERNRNYVQAGYGFGLGYDMILDDYDAESGYDFSSFGPVVVGYERALTKRIGVGLTVSYAACNAQWSDSSDIEYKWSNLAVMARGAYHFHVCNPVFDPYIGLGLGYVSYSSSFTSSDPDVSEDAYPVSFPSAFGWQIFSGARYMPFKNFGIYAELCYGTVSTGISFANCGLTYKF